METKINFIKNELTSKILNENDDLREYELINCDVEIPHNLDGFMSTIFLVKLNLKSKLHQKLETREIIVKLIRFSDDIRNNSNFGEQFINEIFVYKKLIPYFAEILKKSNANFSMSDLVPRAYFAAFDFFPMLGQMKETILAMENLNISGYRLGPRLTLNEDHLFLMAKSIARYHSFTYAMRIQKDPKLQEFLNEIIPIKFIKDDGEVADFNHLYVIGFERLFNYLEENPHHLNPMLKKDLDGLKKNYSKKPFHLMERLRKGGDDDYSVILHGDYIRNNVMFQYDKIEGYDNPKNCKIFDFQEMRYGSPALDISFFMFMNMDPKLYESFWDILLKYYHDTLIENIINILKCNKDDPRLTKYSYTNFLKHFKEFAFYGAAVSIHFIPWMTCTETICTRLAELIEIDLWSNDFKELTFLAGGNETNEIIVNVIKQASKLGYMDVVHF